MSKMSARLVCPDGGAQLSKLFIGDDIDLFELLPVTGLDIRLRWDELVTAHVMDMDIEILDGTDVVADLELEPLAEILRAAGYTVTEP